MTAALLDSISLRSQPRRRRDRRFARTEGYLIVAATKFLEGTDFRSPVEAVESGAKSIIEWCDCLAQTRADFAVKGHLHGE